MVASVTGVVLLVREMAALRPWELGPLADDNARVRDRSTEVTLPEVKARAAWLLAPEDSSSDVWALFVHGLGSQPERTMQGVHVFEERGITCLFISHSAGRPEHKSAHSFGTAEWPEVLAWVQYAQDHGAKRIVLVGWSYGALLALQTASNMANECIVIGLLLDSPLLDWPKTIKHATSRLLVPPPIIRWILWGLKTPFLAWAAGLPAPVRIASLNMAKIATNMRIPVLAIHGSEDKTIPFATTKAFCDGHPERQFELFHGSSHSAERYSDPNRWDRIVQAWLTDIVTPETPQ